MKTQSRKMLLIAGGMIACATAHATLLLSEDFESLVVGDLNGQNGWTANAALDVVAGGHSYSNGDIVINGGTKHIAATGQFLPLGNKDFTSQSGDVWFSLTYSATGPAGDRSWMYVGTDAAISTGQKAVIGDQNDGGYSLQAAYRNGSTQVASGHVAAPAASPFFLVARFWKSGTHGVNYDQVNLWVNPDSATLGTAHATAIRDVTLTEGIDIFGLSTGGTGSFEWDNILVGTTQADVLDVYVIPEPSTLMLVSIAGLLGVLGLRRKGRSNLR